MRVLHWPHAHLCQETGDRVPSVKDQDLRVQDVVSLATLGSDLPAHLHRPHHELALAQVVQVRQELDIILPLQGYWGTVFGEVTVGGGKTTHLG